MKNNNFLDIRNHGFFRIATVSPRVFLADPQRNVLEHLSWIKRMEKKGAQLIVFPELSLSGYSCQDLFLSSALQTEVSEALEILLSKTLKVNSLVVVGMPLLVADKLFNVGVVILRGKILGIIPKTYLPDYREFRETRWFATANHAQEKEIEVLGQIVPFGTVILIKAKDLPNFVMALDICEDIWMPVSPGSIASLNGATVLTNLSGSN